MSLEGLEGLVVETLAGSEASWQRLWQSVEPKLYATLRRPNLIGRLSQNEDDCRSIVVDVMARLRADGFARLKSFIAARQLCPTLPFMAWLLVVAKRVAIDHMRAHDTYIDRRHVENASSPGAWRKIGTLPSDSQLPGERPAFTARSAARQVLAYAEINLPPEQREALEAWIAGASFEEIAGTGDRREAERSVRAALRRLRRRFREEHT